MVFCKLTVPGKHLLLILIFLFSLISFCAAEKVTLDPSNWGLEEGEACISCHEKSSKGLAHQWKNSAHARAKVNCFDCHQADESDIDAIEHEGSIIATIVSPKDCGRCHTTEYKQQKGSVHSQAVDIIKNTMPKLAENLGGQALGVAGCDKCHGSVVRVKGDGQLDPATWPNTGIGRINPDGSKGSCSACHGRHEFSRAQARQPGACTHCHSGIESPDKEVFEASKHGTLYEAHKSKMNLDSDQWAAGKDYYSAPTCVTCHMGTAGKIKSNHDVGMRDAWNLNKVVSEKQYLIIFEDGDKRELSIAQDPPKRGDMTEKLDGNMGKVKAVASPKRRRQAMKQVCLECHNKNFTQDFMLQFDNLVELYNEKFGKPAAAIMQYLYTQKKLTPQPFDEPIELTYWELWHNEGTRARHGAAMASASYTWGEGFYQLAASFYGKFLPQLRQLIGKQQANELIKEHIGDSDYHSWLHNSDNASSILGYDKGQSDED